MKKVLSLCLAAAFTLSLMVSGCIFSVSADTGATASAPWILIDSGLGYTGDVCTTMNIRIFNNPGISYLKIKVTYPDSYYHAGEPIDVVSLLLVMEQDFPGVVIAPLEEGSLQTGFYLIWESSDNQDVATDGVLAGLVFGAGAENEAIDQVPVRLYCQTGDAMNSAGDTVEFKTGFGDLTLWLCRVGDVNCDGKTNNRDLGFLQQYLNREDVWASPETSDVNGDGQVNNRDLGLMQRYLNHWDVELYNPMEHFDGTVAPPVE